MLQLCSTKCGRKHIRDRNAYVILRSLHMWETDPAGKLAAENLISIMIDDEPAKGMEDLRSVEIPEEVEMKLQKAYEEQEKEVEEETSKLRAEGEQKEVPTRSDSYIMLHRALFVQQPSR